MLIDKKNGDVLLSNGFKIHADLTQSSFKNTPYFEKATAEDHGTLPFIHYHMNGASLEHKPIHVSLCFYGEILLEVSISASLYPPDSKSWKDYSLDIEAQIKDFHDEQLKEILGKPHKKYGLRGKKWPRHQKSLKYSYEYTYHWGRVFSCHDERGGGTYIFVSYGNRKQEAKEDYRRRNPKSPKFIPPSTHPKSFLL